MSTPSETPVSRISESAPPEFAGLARLGANAPWRYLLAVLLVAGGGFVVTAVVFYGAARLGYWEAIAALQSPAVLATRPFGERLVAFLVLVSGVVAFLPFVRVVLPWLHRRPWRSFLTAAPRFRWGLAAWSFAAMAVLTLTSLGLQLLIAPDQVRFAAPETGFVLMALAGLAVLPLQVLTEEVVFRGYLTQLTGRLTRARLVRVGVPAALFTLAHMGNPEMTHDALWSVANYALAGLYLGLLVARTDGLEASAGLHLASNLFVLLVASPSVSVFPARALFTDIDSDFRIGFIGSFVVYSLHYVFLCRILRPLNDSTFDS